MNSLPELVHNYRMLPKKSLKSYIKKLIIQNRILNRIRNIDIFELVKEFKVVHIAQFGFNNTYNNQLSIFENLGYNCVDIYIKYNYIIKYRYNNYTKFVSITGKYTGESYNEIVPDDIEQITRKFIAYEILDILGYIDS